MSNAFVDEARSARTAIKTESVQGEKIIFLNKMSNRRECSCTESAHDDERQTVQNVVSKHYNQPNAKNAIKEPLEHF